MLAVRAKSPATPSSASKASPKSAYSSTADDDFLGMSMGSANADYGFGGDATAVTPFAGKLTHPVFSTSMQGVISDGLPAFETLIGFDVQDQLFASIPPSPTLSPGARLGSWCEWMRPGATLSVMSKNPLSRRDPSLPAYIMHRPRVQQGADLIIQALRCFPTMMLRRETFPWFIHSQSHILFGSSDKLPEALSTCMGIAQMFAARTPETEAFIWRTITSEHRNFVGKVFVLGGQQCHARIGAASCSDG